jgi:hypothetical protein
VSRSARRFASRYRPRLPVRFLFELAFTASREDGERLTDRPALYLPARGADRDGAVEISTRFVSALQHRPPSLTTRIRPSNLHQCLLQWKSRKPASEALSVEQIEEAQIPHTLSALARVGGTLRCANQAEITAESISA